MVAIAFSGLALRHHLAKPLRVTWPLRERLVLLLAYAAGFGAAHATQGAVDSFAALPLSLAAGALAFAATLVLAGGLNRRDRRRLSELATWARARRAAGVAGASTESST